MAKKNGLKLTYSKAEFQNFSEEDPATPTYRGGEKWVGKERRGEGRGRKGGAGRDVRV